MRTLHLLTCPLEPNYHFYNRCTIPCLYNSNRCRNNCIQLSVPKNNSMSTLSSAEVLYYKKEQLAGLSVKAVNRMKKEGIVKIQNLYTFNYYLEFVRHNYFDLRSSLCASGFHDDIQSTRILNILGRYPFNIPLFKTHIVDLVLLFSDSIFEDFRKRKKLSQEVKYLDVLNMREIKLQKARKVLKKYLLRKGITHEFSKEENQSTTHPPLVRTR